MAYQKVPIDSYPPPDTESRATPYPSAPPYPPPPSYPPAQPYPPPPGCGGSWPPYPPPHPQPPPPPPSPGGCPPYGYQGYFNDACPYPPPPPSYYQHHQHHHSQPHNQDWGFSFLRGCLATLCCCFLLEECCF